MIKPDRQRQEVAFRDSDFAGVTPADRRALIESLNALSERVQQANEALKKNVNVPSIAATDHVATDRTGPAEGPPSVAR